jgi:hypothetical protein
MAQTNAQSTQPRSCFFLKVVAASTVFVHEQGLTAERAQLDRMPQDTASAGAGAASTRGC